MRKDILAIPAMHSYVRNVLFMFMFTTALGPAVPLIRCTLSPEINLSEADNSSNTEIKNSLSFNSRLVFLSPTRGSIRIL
jgi:hypothetical protein